MLGSLLSVLLLLDEYILVIYCILYAVGCADCMVRSLHTCHTANSNTLNRTIRQ